MSTDIRAEQIAQSQAAASFQDDDEIDLSEVFATLRSKTWLIAATAILGLVLATSYAFLGATPTFRADSTLVLQSSSSAPNLGQLQGLSALAGLSLGSAGGDSDRLSDRIGARDFILGLSDQLGFADDPYFNRALRSPGFFDNLVAKLRGGGVKPMSQAEIKESIVEAFRKSVDVSVSDSGVVKVSTSHEVAARAAEISNAVVNTALAQILEEKKNDSHALVEYLASELRQTQEDLDAATRAVEDFTVTSKLVSPEGLALVSSQLSDLRQRRDQVIGYQSALASIGEMAQSGTALDNAQINALLNDHPQANDPEFRRLLDWTGNSNLWVWPNTAQLADANNSVAQWRTDVDRQIAESESTVRNNATSAGQLAKLRREVTVQEAIYKALLQQFESQSVSGGFNGSPGTVYEVAVTPTKPSAPRKSVFALIGFVGGLVIGVIIAMISSARLGVLYSSRAIVDVLGLRPWGRNLGRALSQKGKSTDLMLRRLNKNSIIEIDEVAVDLTRRNLSEIVLLSTTAGAASRGLALYLTSSLAVTGKKIALIDLSLSIPTSGLTKQETSEALQGLEGFKLEEGSTLLRPAQAHAFNAMTLQEQLTLLRSEYAILIILTPTLPAGAAMVAAALGDADAAIITAKPGKSTRPVIERTQGVLARHPKVLPYVILE